MLQEAPEQRWTIQKVLDHVFFREIQENINAKGKILELEEGAQVKEGEPVPAVDERKKESGVVAVQEEKGEGEKKAEESEVEKTEGEE